MPNHCNVCSQPHYRFYLGICMCIQSLDAEQLNSNQETYFQYQRESQSLPVKRCFRTGIWRSPSMHETSLHEVSVCPCSYLGRWHQHVTSAKGRYTAQIFLAFSTDFNFNRKATLLNVLYLLNHPLIFNSLFRNITYFPF